MPSTGHLPGAFLFKLDRTRVSERRVATLGIINLFDEARQRGNDVVESLVLHQVDLFDLECLHEALGLGVVVWVAASRVHHAARRRSNMAPFGASPARRLILPVPLDHE